MSNSDKDKTPKPRKPRESQPWRVYRIEPGDQDEASTVLTLADKASYPNLADAEAECKKSAASELGVLFVAAKCSRIFQGEEVRTVEVRRS